MPVMHHYVGRSHAKTLLWATTVEALVLWRMLVDAFPELDALALLPDHFHMLLPHDDAKVRLGRAKSGYSRWRKARGGDGDVWEEGRPPVAVQDDQHLRRTRRYILLNGVRARISKDPLDYAWSTHRDRCGLAWPAVGPAAGQPARWHKYVSSDDTVDPKGTPMPVIRYEGVTWEDVRDAVCAVCRVLPGEIAMRPAARALFVRAAWLHGQRDPDVLGAVTHLGRRRIQQLVVALPPLGSPREDQALEAVLLAAGDPRFAGLGTVTSTAGWGRYRSRAGSWASGFRPDKLMGVQISPDRRVVLDDVP